MTSWFVFFLKYFMSVEKDTTLLFLGLVFGAILTLEKLITIYHARHFIKEYIPVEKRFRRIPQPKPVSRTGVVDPAQDYEEERVTFE